MGSKTIIFVTALTLVTLFAGVGAVFADDKMTGIDETAGTVMEKLNIMSKGAVGKAIFFLSLFVGIICLLFTKHRMFGMIALGFGLMMGAFTGIADGLWNIFNKK